MSTDGGQRTKYLVPFAYFLAILAPITAPLFAWGLAREGDEAHAVGVLVLAVVWTAVAILFIL